MKRDGLFAVLYFYAICSVFLVLVGTGCKPDYPNCKTDEHCKDHNEVCVMGQCQQCRDDSNCEKGYECKQNRCVKKPECYTNTDCAEGLVCKDGKCKPECTQDAECGPNMKCQNNRCVPAVECTSDIDCEEGKVCENNKCVEKKVECQIPERIHFDFDDYSIREDAKPILEQVAECMKQKPDLKITIEGHCDERGSIEYNLSLGEKRANAAKQYLINLGISSDRIDTVSYGEERPLDPGHNEEAWAKNRRDEFVTK